MTDRFRSDGRAYEAFSAAVEVPMTVLAIVWVPLIIVPLTVHLHGSLSSAINVGDYVLWAVFVVEYLLKLWLAPDRWYFVKTHKLDLAMVALPMLRPLRVARVLRLLRGFAVLGDSLGRGRKLLTHRGLHYVLLSVALIVFASAGLEVVFEAHTKGPTGIHDYGQALWWAVVTVTTIGYGDRVPLSPAGQGVAVVLMLVGIGLVGVLTATIASYFVTEESNQIESDIASIRDQLDRIEARLALMVPAEADAAAG